MRIRILVVTNFYPPQHIGGYELRCRSVVERLRARGHTVRVLTGRPLAAAPVPLEPGVSRRLHVNWGPPYPPEDLCGLLRAETADRLHARRLIAAFQPQVIDLWGMQFGSQAFAAWLLSSCGPVHVNLGDVWLLEAHRYDPLCQTFRLAKRLDVPGPPGLASAAPRLGDRAACFVSESLLRTYIAARASNSRCRVLVPGIDLRPFDGLACRPPPPFRILCVGRVMPERGQQDVVAAVRNAASALRDRLPIHLRIVGAGDESLLKSLPESSAVEFPGVLPPEAMPGEYGRAHLLIHASRLPEGLPRVIVEALVAGVPVIATTSGGQRDALENGRWGRLVPPADVVALTAAIVDAVRNYAAWRRRAAEARERAQARFDLDRYVRDYELELSSIADPSTGETPRGTAGAPLPSTTDIGAFARALGDACEAATRPELPLDPHELWQLGVALKRTGRTERAEQVFARLYEEHSEDSVHVRRATLHLAELCLLRGAWTTAASWLERCLRVAPEHAKARYDQEWTSLRRIPPHLAGTHRVTGRQVARLNA